MGHRTCPHVPATQMGHETCPHVPDIERKTTLKSKLNGKKLLLPSSVLVGMLLFSGCSQQAAVEDVADPVIPVAITEVSGGALSDIQKINGTVKPGQDVELVPASAGEIVAVHVKKGDKVKEGQVIATLDTSNEQLSLKQARESLTRAQNGLKNAQQTQKQAVSSTVQAENSVRQQEASLVQAQANLEQGKNGRTDGITNANINVGNAQRKWDETKRELDRITALYNDGLVSKQQLEQAQDAEKQAESTYNSAKISAEQAQRQDNVHVLEAAVEQARIAIDSAKKRIDDAKINENVAAIGVQNAQVAVNEAQISVEQAQKLIDDKVIKAPIAGEIMEITAEKGEFVSSATYFARIISTNSVHVEAMVTAEQLFLIETGDKIDVYLPPIDQTVPGTITYIAPTSDQSNLYKVEVNVENKDGKIISGMIAQLNVEQVLVENGVLVPTEAIVEKNDAAYIFVLNGETVKKIDIEIVQSETEFSAVQGEIAKGSKVVSKGQNLLNDGDKVTVQEEEK